MIDWLLSTADSLCWGCAIPARTQAFCVLLTLRVHSSKKREQEHSPNWERPGKPRNTGEGERGMKKKHGQTMGVIPFSLNCIHIFLTCVFSLRLSPSHWGYMDRQGKQTKHGEGNTRKYNSSEGLCVCPGVLMVVRYRRFVMSPDILSGCIRHNKDSYQCRAAAHEQQAAACICSEVQEPFLLVHSLYIIDLYSLINWLWICCLIAHNMVITVV